VNRGELTDWRPIRMLVSVLIVPRIERSTAGKVQSSQATNLRGIQPSG
jgi:hypothetical protein